MALSLGQILIDISADTSKLVSGFNRAESLVTKTTDNMTKAVKTFASAYISLNAIDLANTIAKQADAMTNVTSKLKLVTSSSEELVSVQKELYKLSQNTRTSFTDVVGLYSNLASSLNEMGKSQEEIVRTTETVNKAIAISGSTTQEAAASVQQLGQAFASGKLSGDELKSILENSKGLAKAIADGMGVPIGALKNLGAEGKITSEVLYNALTKSAITVDEKFLKMEKTIGGTAINIKNSVLNTIGEFDNMTGASESIAKYFEDISKSLDSLKPEQLMEVAKQVATITVTVGVSAAAFKTYKNAMIMTEAIIALGELNRAIIIATASTRLLSLATNSIPYIAIASSIYMIADAWINASSEAEKYQKKWTGTTGKGAVVDYNYDNMIRDLQKAYNTMETSEKAYLKMKGTNQEKFFKDNYEKTKANYKKLENEANKSSNEIFKIENKTAVKAKTKQVSEKSKEEIAEEKRRAKEILTLTEQLNKEIIGTNRNYQLLGVNESQKKYEELEYQRLDDLEKYKSIKGAEDKINQEYALKKKMLDDEVIKNAEIKNKELLEKETDDLIDQLELQNKIIYDRSKALQDLEMAKFEDIEINIKLNGFDDVSNGIASMINGFTDVTNSVINLNKVHSKYGKDSKEFGEASVSLNQDIIGSTVGMTGAIANFYDEDDDRRKKQMELAKAMQVVQMVQNTAFLAMEFAKAQAAGATAVAIAAQVPIIGIAMGASMIAFLASVGIMLSGSGGGKSSNNFEAIQKNANYGSSISERSGVSLEDYSQNFDAFIKGLDKASERLEAFGSVGSSLSNQLETIINEISAQQSIISTNAIKLQQLKDGTYVGINKFGFKQEFTGTDAAAEANKTKKESKKVTANIQKLTDELTSILTESVQENLDYSILTAQQLTNVIGDFSKSDFDKTLSQINDIAIIAKQQGGVLTEQQKQDLITLYTLPNFIKGQDYKEAIEQLNELNEAQIKNIKSFTDSFKTDEQLAQDLANSLNVNLANSYDGLNRLFETLKGGIDGLNDNELELLEANKALLDANVEAIKSSITNNINTLQGLINSLTSTNITNSLDSFRMAMNSALNATDTESLSGALENVSRYIGALSDTNNFSTSRDMEFAKAVARNQLIGLEETAKTQIDYLSSIAKSSEMTAMVLSNASNTVQAPSTLTVLQNNMTTSTVNNSSILEQNNKLNDIISKLQEHLTVARENRDINNSSLVQLENILAVS